MIDGPRDDVLRLEELTPRPDTPPDRTTLRFIPDLDILVPSPKLISSKSGIDLRAVRSGGVSGLGVSSSRSRSPEERALPRQPSQSSTT